MSLMAMSAKSLAGPWQLSARRTVPKAPPAERYEVRIVIDRKGSRPARRAVSWHLKEDRALAAGRKCADAGHEVQVCWTHSDDKWLGEWLDDAMVVWDSRYPEEEQ
jgi:hypothetical protein